jgi:hypothetical protein
MLWRGCHDALFIKVVQGGPECTGSSPRPLPLITPVPETLPLIAPVIASSVPGRGRGGELGAVTGWTTSQLATGAVRVARRAITATSPIIILALIASVCLRLIASRRCVTVAIPARPVIATIIKALPLVIPLIPACHTATDKR